MKLTDLAIRLGIAALDPEPEPANLRWAEALLDGKDEPKESAR